MSQAPDVTTKEETQEGDLKDVEIVEETSWNNQPEPKPHD